MAWTNPRTWLLGELVTETLLNTHVRDNLNFLKSNPLIAEVAGSTQIITADGSTVVALQLIAVAIPADAGAVHCEAWCGSLQTYQHQSASLNAANLQLYDNTGSVVLASAGVGVQASGPQIFASAYLRSQDYAWAGTTRNVTLYLFGSNSGAVLNGPYVMRIVRSY